MSDEKPVNKKVKLTAGALQILFFKVKCKNVSHFDLYSHEI